MRRAARSTVGLFESDLPVERLPSLIQTWILVVDPSLNFHRRLYDRIRPHVMAWAGSPSAFVIVGLLEAPDFDARAELLQTLREHRSQLEAMAGPESTPATVSHKKKNARPSERQRQQRQTPGDYHVIGHRGARLILEKIDSSS